MCLQLIESRAALSPGAEAVLGDGRPITYGELDHRACEIALGLSKHGVGARDLVAVLLHRSPQMIAALLGIWKTGAAYLPIDPAAPGERVAQILEDAGVRFILTQKEIEGIVVPKAAKLIRLDQLDARGKTGVSPPISAGAAPGDSIAYVIYTSGSTGRPKGVRITHKALANTIQAVGADLELGSDDIVLAWSTIAFDVACLEIFLPLAFGARVYLVEEAARDGAGSRCELLRRSAATAVFATPTMYRLLLAEGWRGDPRIQLIAGGEALSLSLARRLAGMCRVLWNQYGPSETAICATRARVEPGIEKVTIGSALPNVTVHVLDAQMQPVEPGAAGEMYIGGPGVGPGYLRRPELNRTAFLPDPFRGAAGGLVYRTGDLARQLPDGSYEFLGRADGQVKLRGYRIELGEIETALEQCEGVQSAVVRAMELSPGDQRLIAFVVGQQGSAMMDWKRLLGRRLPSYMIPSELRWLSHLPTTPSGKVDVLALERMRLQEAKVQTLSPAIPMGPSDTLETRLLAIWKRLLGIERIGISDDFFSLGGHSLLAARLLVELEQQLGRKLPHSALVQHPTISALAAYIRRGSWEEWSPIIKLQARTNNGAEGAPLFLAHGLGGSVLTFVDLAAELGAEHAIYGLQLPVAIRPEQAAIDLLAETYLRQMRALEPRGPYHLAGHSSGGLVVCEIACRLLEQGETVGLLALLDCDLKPGQSAESWTRSLAHAYTRFKQGEAGVRQLARRRMDHQRIQYRAWRAQRDRRAGRTSAVPILAEGYLALALREHRLQPYSGTATLFIARDEPASALAAADGWNTIILSGCETTLIDGTHQTMLKPPHVSSLAAEMRWRMRRGEKAAQRDLLNRKQKLQSLASF